MERMKESGRCEWGGVRVWGVGGGREGIEKRRGVFVTVRSRLGLHLP